MHCYLLREINNGYFECVVVSQPHEKNVYNSSVGYVRWIPDILDFWKYLNSNYISEEKLNELFINNKFDYDKCDEIKKIENSLYSKILMDFYYSCYGNDIDYFVTHIYYYENGNWNKISINKTIDICEQIGFLLDEISIILEDEVDNKDNKDKLKQYENEIIEYKIKLKPNGISLSDWLDLYENVENILNKLNEIKNEYKIILDKLEIRAQEYTKFEKIITKHKYE